MHPRNNDSSKLVTTDEAILSSIGEGDEPTSSESPDEEDSGTEANTTTQTPSADSGQSTTQGDEGQQPAKTHGPQDLLDANGNVIATGGKERRFYETARREKTRADQASREVETLKAQLEAINSAGTIGTQYDLTPEEVSTGAQLIASYKKNPVETVQYMLTQLQGSGYNVDGITSGGVDMAAVKQMLDTALAPLVGDRQERLDTQEAYSRAEEIYNTFSSQFPDAQIHENSLARLLKADPSLSPEAAYYKLQNFYLQNSLDWKKPLEVLQEEAKGSPSSVNTQQQPPDGGGVSARNVTNTANVADVNTSTDDIIRQAMKEAGITS